MNSKHLFTIIRISFSLFFISFLFANCNSSQAQSAQIKRIGNQELQQILESKEVHLIDVRTPNEYNQGHLMNATLIDFMQSDFKEKISKLDKSKPIIVYCAVGGRSQQSLSILESAGFTEIYDLKRGIRGWLSEGLPVTK